MKRSIFNSSRGRLHTFRIEYNILVNGTSYSRSIDFDASDADKAKAEWESFRHKSTSTEEYLFVSITKIR